MKKADVLEQAHYIFTTGRQIHDQILKVQAKYLAAKASSASSELSVAQLHTIGVVRKLGSLTMGELAEQLGITAPSASAMVDRLVEKQILIRAHSTEDRRKVVVSISPAVDQEIEAMEHNLLSIFCHLVEELGTETARKWCEVLTAVQKVITEDGLSRFMPADTKGSGHHVAKED